MLKVILFTHDDMDGRGCDIIFRLAQHALGRDEESDFEVVVCHNSSVDEQVRCTMEYAKSNADTEVIFSDICAHRDVIDELLQSAADGKIKSVMVYDHHKTNEWVKDVIPDAAIVPVNDLGKMESGTSLIYQGMSDTITSAGYDIQFIGNFVDRIRSYDTYEWKSTNDVDAKKLDMLFYLVGGDFFVQKYYNRIVSNDPDKSLITENDLVFVNCKYEAELNAIAKITIDDMIITTIHGYKVALLLKSVPANMSEVGYSFLKRNPDIDVFIAFTLTNGGTFQIRTQREDLDVGAVFALPLGGGGHPKASGAQLSRPMKRAIMDILTRYLKNDNFVVGINSVTSAYVNDKEGMQ